MERQKYNKLILETLSKLVEKYPDWRFGQILVNIGVIQYEKDVLIDGQREDLLTIDPFYEESKLTWERMFNSKFFKDEKSDIG